MSYGVKYQLEYKDQILEGAQGRKTTIKILEKDYSGSVTEVDGGSDPLVITASSDNDYMFTPIIGSSAKITLISSSSFQFVDIFTANARKYLVEVWKEPTPNATQELFWTGYVVPDNYGEPLHYHANYPVTIEAIDGLARLQDFDFLDTDGLKYSGKFRALDIIRVLLEKTGLVLDIDIALSWDEIYSTTSGVPALVTKYLDPDTFYFKEVPKCDYVLEQILQSFGARIIQNKGRWVIKECTKNTGTHNVYRSVVADTPITYSHNPVKSYSRARNYDRLVFINKEGYLQINPAYKKFAINHDFLLKPSILINSSFEEFTETGGNGVVVSGGNRRSSSNLSTDFVRTFPGWTITPNDFYLYPRTEPGYEGYFIRMPVGFGANYSYYLSSNPINISLNNRESYFSIDVRDRYCQSYVEIIIGNYWVNADGDLVTTRQRHLLSFANNEVEFYKFELKIKASTVSGDLIVKIYKPYSGSLNPLERPFFDIDNVVFKYQNSEVSDKISFDVNVDENNNFIPNEINSILGDVPNVLDREDIYLGTYWRFDGTNYIPTLYWQNELGEQATILQLLANLILDTHYKPKQYLTGLRFKGNFDFDSSLQVNFLDNRIYLPINYEYHDKYAEWVIDCVEVLADRLLATEGDDFIMTENNDFILV